MGKMQREKEKKKWAEGQRRPKHSQRKGNGDKRGLIG
jgi:hypothetical protein